MEGTAGGLSSILVLEMNPCPVLAKVSCGLVSIMPENLQRQRLHNLYGKPPVLHCSVKKPFPNIQHQLSRLQSGTIACSFIVWHHQNSIFCKSSFQQCGKVLDHLLVSFSGKASSVLHSRSLTSIKQVAKNRSSAEKNLLMVLFDEVLAEVVRS